MNDQPENEHIVSDIYDNYNETQREILVIETRKTRNKLITIAIVIFTFALISLSILNAVTTSTLASISIVPAVMALLALLSNKEPLLAMVISALIVVGIWIYSITLYGERAIVAGWIEKVILIYLIFAGFQNAREAQRIKKELKI